MGKNISQNCVISAKIHLKEAETVRHLIQELNNLQVTYSGHNIIYIYIFIYITSYNLYYKALQALLLYY